MKPKIVIPAQFLELLRCGLWGTTPDAALFRALTPEQWQSLLLMSHQQAVTGLTADSLLRLPETCQPPAALRLQWIGYHQGVLRQHDYYKQVRQEVLGWFDETGIRYAVFKGDTLNTLYPVPGLRMNGDVDLWLPEPDGVDRAVSLLRSRGADIRDPENHHIVVHYKEVSFELHHDFLNLPFTVRVPHTLIQETGNVFHGYRLNPEADTVMILTHAAHHFMEMGLGLRHLCDWAAWLHRKGQLPEVQRGLQEIRRLGAGVFLTEFTALAMLLLGLELPQGDRILRRSRAERRERLLHELLLQGNLGKSHLDQKKPNALIRFYLSAFFRELTLYSFWPRYIVANLPHQIKRTRRKLFRY